jgi:hypothetical protein
VDDASRPDPRRDRRHLGLTSSRATV